MWKHEDESVNVCNLVNWVNDDIIAEINKKEETGLGALGERTGIDEFNIR